MQNWGGNITYSATEVLAPGSMRELHEAITVGTAGRKIRTMGSRHSFNLISDAPTIIDTRSMPEFLQIGLERTTVTVNGAMTYGRLVELIAPLGFAVHNLASLPHISIAGAIATGSHGSGDQNGNLATAVAEIQLMTASGEMLSFERGDPDFAGAIVSLGSLGVVTAVTLDVEPAFMVEQRVYDGPTLAELATSFADVFSSAYSVSAFTSWEGQAEQIWVKHRTNAEFRRLDFAEATEKRHPLMGMDADACTDQFGEVGLWSDRLPHFKLDFTPSAGDEIQSEFFVDRRNAAAAIRAVSDIGNILADALLVGELRTIAGDDLWLSPHYGRDSLAFHFTWVPDQAKAEVAASHVVDALSDLAPRSHWGKLFDPKQFDFSQFDHLDDFRALVRRVDPEARFSNNWLAELFTS